MTRRPTNPPPALRGRRAIAAGLTPRRIRERRILDGLVDQGVKRNLNQEIQVKLAQHLQRVTRAF